MTTCYNGIVAKDYATGVLFGFLVGLTIWGVVYGVIKDKQPNQKQWDIYEDQDNGVTCYIYGQSISCLPTKDLTK